MSEQKKQNRVAKLIKLDNGGQITGTYLGITVRDWVDTQFSDGEIKAMSTYIFKDKEGKRFMMRGDSGFKAAFDSALVKEGETIRIVKGDKVDIGNDRYMNTYEIFEA